MVVIQDIAYAVHQSVVKKISGMYKRISSLSNFPIHLVGGGALNRAVRTLLEKELTTNVIIPEYPQVTIALGASIIASEK